MNPPAWEKVFTSLPDEYWDASIHGKPLNDRERESAADYAEAARVLLDVIGDGQTALLEVILQRDELTLPGRHIEALLSLAAALGSAACQLTRMERYATEYLAIPAEGHSKQIDRSTDQ